MDIEIVSGFLGAGKTTFLNQYLPLLTGKTVVIENEYGEIGLDGALVKTDIPVKEIYTGCICCGLAAAPMKTMWRDLERFIWIRFSRHR